ncbi:phosphoadenosine phosphosulfate reductase [Szabonella alba]|uniref:Phosphoadenosine phosphosulfate reductase n=1 Tax=Szabonella alba TaxID=2804194 RepID=A0A8K0Y171_9RHOB|nr:phosphoadenosine phosphosulfate reductase [Szabonella alba]MBL4917582.1 phosphoadenosine phosphosulfate reductase [Szabonella alba]
MPSDDMEISTETTPPPAAALDRDDWLTLLRGMGEEGGGFETLGPRHWALFNEDGGDLLVTFDALETITAGSAGQMPPAFALATRRGWSHLSVIVEGPDRYRSANVYRYFDRLVDEDFFGGFDRVLFFGAGAAAHAACAFSVAAPGAQVLALDPCATLDPRQAGWDQRHRALRRLDFTTRYGYGPDMVAGAAQVHLLFDPLQREDAMHAALYRGPHVTPLRLPHLGGETESDLQAMGILPEILTLAMAGGLAPGGFARLWRKRRDTPRYLRNLLQCCARAGHHRREAAICRWVIARMKAPSFRRHLKDLEARGLLPKRSERDAPASSANSATDGTDTTVKNNTGKNMIHASS